jgi:hypothetical protein
MGYFLKIPSPADGPDAAAGSDPAWTAPPSRVDLRQTT